MCDEDERKLKFEGIKNLSKKSQQGMKGRPSMELTNGNCLVRREEIMLIEEESQVNEEVMRRQIRLKKMRKGKGGVERDMKGRAERYDKG